MTRLLNAAKALYAAAAPESEQVALWEDMKQAIAEAEARAEWERMMLVCPTCDGSGRVDHPARYKGAA